MKSLGRFADRTRSPLLQKRIQDATEGFNRGLSHMHAPPLGTIVGLFFGGFPLGRSTFLAAACAQGSSQGRPRVILWGTCAPPVEFCEVDPMQTESLACTIVESSPPDPCICAQQMVCRLSMRSLNRSGCARARARTIQVFRGRAGARALLAFRRYLDSGVTWILALCMPVFARACARSEAY